MMKLPHILLTLVAAMFVAIMPVRAQKGELKITGKITDASTGTPLAGANVSVEGYSAAMTNDSGLFVVKVKSCFDELTITRPAYQGKRLALKGNKNVNVALFEEGYASVFKNALTPMGEVNNSRLTSAVKTLDQDFSLRPVSSADQLLQGNVAGLNGLTRSGMEGAGLNFFLQGFNSIYTNNQPLLVVDGMVVENHSNGISLIDGYIATPMGTIDVRDIQRISVIKDATTIYGVKGANGVILIETLRSKDQATQIKMQAQTGINLRPTELPLLSAAQQKSYLIDMYKSTGKYSATDIQNLAFVNQTKPVLYNWGYEGNEDYYKYNQNTNWQKELFQQGIKNKYTMNVTGGDETAIYAISLGYLLNEGLVKGTDYSRFNARVNSEIKFTKDLKVRTGMSFVYGSKNLASQGAVSTVNPIYTSLVKSPFTSPYVYNQEGLRSPNTEDVDMFGNSNPVKMQDATQINSNYGFLGNFTIDYQILKSLKFSSMSGLNYNKDRERVFLPSEGIVYEELPISVVTNKQQHRVERLFSLTNETKLNFNTNVKEDQNLNVNAGFRYMTSKAEDDWGKGYNSSSNYYRSISYGLSALRQVGGSLGTWNWLSYFASADYSIKDRYFLNATASADASSRYGSGVGQYQVYPSVSGAWLISSEGFMKDASAVDMMKLRAGYYASGNDDIGNYTARYYYVPQNMLGNYGLVRGNIINTNLRPERHNKFALGFDLAVLNERASMSVDLYHTRVSDMITNSKLSPLAGFQTYISNGGEMTNRGIDLTFNGRLLNGPVKWDMGLTVSHYKNKITKLDGDAYLTSVGAGYVQTKVGQPLGVFYGYKTEGVYATSAQASANQLYTMVGAVKTPFTAGDVRFKNLSGSDNLIDANDMTVIGDPNPDIYGGLNTSVKWKKFNVSALFTYSLGNEVYNYTRQVLESIKTFDNQTQAVLNRWKVEGQVTDMPKAVYGDPMQNSRFSDRFVEDGSYVKLKNVTFSYDVPVKKLSFLDGLQVYAVVENLCTITKYKGYDPEFSLSGNPLGYGVDCFNTPLARSFYVGVKIGL
ncbi:SusC/RagA family TonB-linked outer membrane protein [Parabacteroides sp. FAFU027]|uniref:SusC/RagA family TonB-linked outer membrane protein n=1 Tax=Parabacteroides sp. FAFU027 TaxID=2922715 RepID=UPI001FAEDF63|nr:SusC/RagA family TonB-linked outer membrane protein [Parabacteroides sp. FAFU027]